MAALDTVLDKIDANLEFALARLFELIEFNRSRPIPPSPAIARTRRRMARERIHLARL